MDLSNIILTGMNNPDCSFFVGTFLGIGLGIKLIITVAVIGLVFKAMDKLALDPLIDYIKKKIAKLRGRR